VQGPARIEELARLLSGHVTEAALQHARELLEKASGVVAARTRRRAS
jgi:DNA repair ATPase RecN